MIASQCLLARRWEYSDMKSTSHCRTVWTLSADWCHLCRFQEIVYGGRNSLFMSSVWVLPSFIDTRECRHVNSHLDEDESARDQALALELASLPDVSPIKVSEPWKLSKVTCSFCQELIPLEEWESHDVMHEIQLEEFIGDRPDQDNCKNDKEENPLKKFRTEECASTSRIPHSVSVRSVQSIVLNQKKEEYRRVNEGIMNLIRDCLYSEKESSCSTVITGYLDHFESRAFEDVGWGCGWRNIQMLGSHLLTHHWAKEVLFGGVGFVPDIPSLQQWLELAWTCGFDEHGAEFYQFKIHGCREWIGTTECAALFRSFGLRARIVDFSSAVRKLENGQATIDRWFQRKVPESGNAQNKMSVQLPGTNEIHLNVECDACGAYPIKGKRYKSKKKENYDLCSSCILQETKQQDYEELTSCRSASLKQEAVKDENVNHEHLIKWVWDYFIDHVSSPVSKACLDLFQGHIATSGSTPLYFQHQGHSRTIVGVQRRKKHAASKEEVFLLVLDPSNKTEELLQSLRSKRNWQKLIKRGVHTLKKRSYQVCYVEPGIAEGQELEELKILKSEHFYN